MGKGLENRKVVIAGSRKTEEMSALIQKQGGTALIRPLQGTVFLAEETLAPELEELLNRQPDWIILTTGIGTEALVKAAESMDKKDELLELMQQANLAVRGYKTVGVLKRLGLTPAASDDDGTTAGLIRAIQNEELQGKRVAVQLHGEKAPALMAFLEEKGAFIQTLMPYRHHAPDAEVVKQLFEEILQQQVDAVCFTTAIQARSLFHYAKETKQQQALLDAFASGTIAGAVGKVTAEALTEEGVSRIVVPGLERMGALIIELSRYYDQQS
ncbi:uroporphyrinogen-III synthase [Bacillus thermotolerans]|uniref:Uroporphyrinogen-III synthase n=1 Tax=Bacillus thermotolerans TaxID=1221996 RepID=A0A0F5I1I2_BACTR|nr:uroporphyrinogen-III synthase [Bacillus thermotolerans]KKB39125.1 Uroporphyrinogen-III synthase [Bacillus thermotolerans]KKB41588.1 Uroporphyrinogen-III synthase [Bacillus thermotolerans]KKB42745.1 Uroporphyrinogen-III synthase [Bacillus thermotolerans]